MRFQAALRDVPIRRKLMYIAFIATGVAMLFAALASTALQWLLLRDELVKSIYSQASIVATNSTSALVFNDREAAEQMLGALSAINSIEFAGLLDKSGKRLAVYVRPGSAMPSHLHPPDEAESSRFSTNHLDVVIPIVFKYERIGSIHVRSSLAPVYEKLGWTMLVTIVTATAALMVAVLMLLGLVPMITNPLRELVEVMNTVTRDSNYRLRAELHGKDEFGMLAQRFNNMLAQIQSRDDILKQHRARLEDDVARRTADFKKANSLLEKELVERKQLEKELLESRERFRGITETTSDWIWQVDQHGNYVYASARVRDILGYEAEEMLGKTPFDFMPRDEAARVRSVFNNIVGSQKAFSFLDNINLHKDGHRVVLETSGVPILGPDGAFQGYFGIDRDITERKKIDEQLRETRDYLENLFNFANAPMIVWSPSYRITMFNHAFERLTGRKAEEFIGKSIDSIFPDVNREESLAHVLLTAKKGFRQEAVEIPIQHSSGEVRTALWNSATLYSADGLHVLATIAQGQDITERKQAEYEIRRLNEELDAKVKERTQQLLAAQDELVRKEKLAVLGRVAGSVGHELRNPLGVMNNAVYFLQTVLADADDSVKEYLNIIKNEIAGSERIVSDLLDSVRTKPPHLEIVGVPELVRQTLNKLNIPSNVTIKLDLPDTLPSLRADPLQIHQVLRNLISNGVEAMPQGGTLEIGARASVPDGKIAISVRDTGSGIAPEMLDKLFQPLFTTKARGIGLGLVVVKNLTQANGGKIEVKSEAGKGSVFTVTLPAADEKGISL